MNIGWPEGILLGLIFIEICVAMSCHGQPRGNYNAGLRLFDAALLLGLLVWGGFFV
jgi:hypothetical protein